MEYLQASLKLHNHLVSEHWTGYAVKGPTPIGKLNWRVTRFIKGCLGWIPWPDQYVFLQGQGYWIKTNLQLSKLTGDNRYLELARKCADYVVEIQQPEGFWKYPPLRERRHRINTVEGVWASLGLVDAYFTLGESRYLEAVLKWYKYQTSVIGFETYKEGLCINYHHNSSELVPNVTTMLLWLTAEINKALKDDQFLQYTDRMIRFLEYAQLESGELQYIFSVRPHFQCFQYNAFQFIDLASYYEIIPDERIYHIIKRMAAFLSTGLTHRNTCRYDCFKETPEFNYWVAALGAALTKATQLGLGDYQLFSDRAYQGLLSHQSKNGEFKFSRKNYYILSDRRSYPQQQVMILNHLLLKEFSFAKTQR